MCVSAATCRFGDITNNAAAIQAMESLGIKARFQPHADLSGLEGQIDRGFPVPCGFIHKGPFAAPYGYGHCL
jgi:hypothetical protein